MQDWIALVVSALSLAVSAGGIIFAARSAKASDRSATASEQSAAAAIKSAEMAERAADTSARSAAASEASLLVNFKVSLERHMDGEVWFEINCVGPSVHVHGIQASLFVLQTSDRYFPSANVEGKPIPGGEVFPVYLHDGERASMRWENPTLRRDDAGACGVGYVSYSITADGPVKTRSVDVESSPGLLSRLKEKYITGPA
ncbi:hypothetical protein NIE79_001437 [Micromonospora sp. NIE79]|uniref:Uncharacterized protein n=1 Tax=Micromonospora trifolii TaxID=2911208 RepID=A0ABS9MUH3_9ACTN|nr:hypothetical protein [Micromonospora trifolii]MCG5441315.1 hypothetical protein [Micromonospora trifolii]